MNTQTSEPSSSTPVSSNQNEASQPQPQNTKRWSKLLRFSWSDNVAPDSSQKAPRPPIVFDFPFDIVEEIVDHVPRSDKHTLRSLSLVCRANLILCQRRLFSELEIDLSAGVSNARATAPPWSAALDSYLRLLDILVESPHIAKYVKKLSFAQSRGVMGEWLKETSTFVDLMDTLVSSPIHTVNIQGYSYFLPLHWSDISDKAKPGFFHVFANPNVQTLILVDVVIPMTFFTTFAGLKNLKLAHARWARGPIPDDIQKRVQKLASIHFIPSGRIPPGDDIDFSSMTSDKGIDFSDVERALVRVNLFSPQPSTFVFPFNSRSLTKLEIELLDGSAGASARSLNLSPFGALSQLTITHYDIGTGAILGFSWIIDTVSSLPTRHNLQSIILRFSNGRLLPYDQYSKIQLFSSTFSRLQESSGHLETISIQVDIYPSNRGIPDEIGLSELKGYITSQVRWSGCESVLDVQVGGGSESS